MAEERTLKINIESNLDEAKKKVNSLYDTFDNLKKKAEEIKKALSETTDPEKISFLKKELSKVNDELGVTNKNLKKTKKVTNGLSTGFKGLGTAIKATGIGLLVTLLASLSSALVENEKVAKPFRVIMETISVVVGDVVNAISKAVETANEATGGFDALGKVVGGALTIAINQLKISFQGIKLGVQAAQLAWEKSFFGGKDANKIKELTEGIEETKQAIIETSKSTTEAGKQIIDNFGEAINEIGTLAENTIDEVSKVDIASAKARAQTNLDLANNAQIAAAQQSLLIERYDRLAEKQRQVRDNDLLSIDDREEANNKLLDILNKQEKAMLSQADAILASAQAQFNKNKRTENQVALLEAQANKEGVLAQIEGFRSEQESNRTALIKERLELQQSGAESDEQRELRRKQFEASREEDDIKRLEREKDILNEELSLEQQRLQSKVDSFAVGTQARLDAENELKDRLQEINQEITANEDEQLKVRNENKKKADDENRKSEELLQSTKLSLQENAFKLATELAEEGSAASKAIQVAQTIMQTIQGVQAAFTTAQKNPITTTFPAYPFIQAGLAGTFGALSVKKILSTPTSTTNAGSVGTSGTGGGGAAQQAPAFNLVGASGVNQVQESLQEEQTPIQAFVVGSEVTTQQELDRNAIDSASIG